MKTISFVPIKALAAILLSLVFTTSVSAFVISEDGDYTFDGIYLEEPITVNAGVTANILFKNLYVNLNYERVYVAPLDIRDNAVVNLTIEGSNILTCDLFEEPGISVPQHAELTINGNGDLTVYGGTRNACIGVDKYINATSRWSVGGTVIINSGNIFVNGSGSGGAGIAVTTVTINGGTVKSIVGSGAGYGVGISGTTVTINGGTVESDGDSGVGIAGSTITINGGTVEANGGSGEGIAGQIVTINGGNVRSVSERGGGIYGEKTVTITGGDVQAVGYGSHGITENITITGGNVQSFGYGGNVGSIAGTVSISGGNVKAFGYGAETAGIGGTISISGGNVKAFCYGTERAGIGGTGAITNGDVEAYSYSETVASIVGIEITGGIVASHSQSQPALSTVPLELLFSDPSLPDGADFGNYQFFVEGNEYYLPDTGIISGRGAVYWIEPKIYDALSLVFRGRVADGLVYTNNEPFDLRNSRSVVLSTIPSCNIWFSTPTQGITLTATELNGNGQPIPSGSKIFTRDTIVFRANSPLIPADGSGYLFKWETFSAQGDAMDTIYTRLPYIVLPRADYINVKCTVETPYLFTFAFDGDILGHEISSVRLRNRNEIVSETSVDVMTEDVVDFVLKKPDARKYEYTVTINGKVQQSCVDTILTLSDVFYSDIDAKISVKRIEQIQFNKNIVYNGVKVDISAKYKGNTYKDLSENQYGGTYSVDSGDWVTVGGDLILTPHVEDNNRYYEYLTTWTNENNLPKDTVFDGIPVLPVLGNTTVTTSVQSAKQSITFSLQHAPAGTKLNIEYGSFTDSITVEEAFVMVQKTVFFEDNTVAALRLITTLPPDGKQYRYRWVGFEPGKVDFIDTTVLIKNDFTLNRKMNIECELLSQSKIEYAFSNDSNEWINTDNLELRAIYDDVPVASGAYILPGRKLTLTVVGNNLENYRYAWEGVENRSGSGLVSINPLYGDIYILCTPIRLSGSAFLESLRLIAGDTIIDALELDVITVAENVDSVTVEATPASGNATVDGTGRYSLAYGDNTITVTVVSEDKSTEKEYQIKIIREKGDEPTGMASPAAASVRVYAHGQTLYIDTPEAEQISVYSLTGNLLNRFYKPAGVAGYRIAARVAIVKGGSGWVRKVVAQ
ncbi:MAG: cadherin-like beta sandwich domain-containing protein [Dysgonamonadaceae bacterium]|nr:cadherin-like beta sandwich domain-containing protein [Dysgonamonadaceae bacterium]